MYKQRHLREAREHALTARFCARRFKTLRNKANKTRDRKAKSIYMKQARMWAGRAYDHISQALYHLRVYNSPLRIVK